MLDGRLRLGEQSEGYCRNGGETSSRPVLEKSIPPCATEKLDELERF